MPNIPSPPPDPRNSDIAVDPPAGSFAEFLHRLSQFEMALRAMPAKNSEIPPYGQEIQNLGNTRVNDPALRRMSDLNGPVAYHWNNWPPKTPLPPDPPPPDREIPPPADDFTAAPLTLEEQDLLAEFDAIRDIVDDAEREERKDVGISPAPAEAGLTRIIFPPESGYTQDDLDDLWELPDPEGMSELPKFPPASTDPFQP